MAPPSSFVPKQAMSFDDKLFQIIGADETLHIAKHIMTLLPSFPSDAIIHDSACGLGPITQEILATSPPSSIKIHATDFAPPMAGIYNQISQARGWQITAKQMDVQNLNFPDDFFSHVFLSFGLPIIENPAAAAKEMYRTLKPGGTAITAFWLQIPQGENGSATRRAIWGPEAQLAIEPKPEHKDREYAPSLLVKGGFNADDIQLFEKSAFLPVRDLDQFSTAIWTAIGQPVGGWTQEDEDRWDEAVATYKERLQKRTGFQRDGNGNITIEAIAQVAIVKKPAV